MHLRQKYLADAARAFDRAPVEVALAIASAALLSYCIHTENNVEESVRFLVAATITGLIAWCATLLHGLGALSSKQRWAVTLVGVAPAALYLLLVPDIEPASEGWRTFMLLTATVLAVFAAPGWSARDDDGASLRLRRINGRIVLRAIGAYLYGLALFAGLALAVVAIDKLFELAMKGDVYAHLYVWIMVALVPWVIVGGLADYVRPLNQQSDVARVVHRMSAFLVPPLIALYFLILYTYALRITVTHEWPQNLVSPMVIAAGLLVGLGLILFAPAPDAAGGQRLLRYAPIVFLPLAPLGLWGLAARVAEYGWTEFRLLRVVALGLLLALAVLATAQIMRRRPFALRVIPLAASFVLFLCAVGPAGVLPIARRNQQHRLLAGLHAAGVDISKAPADTSHRVIASALYGRVTGSAGYLRSHFGAAAVAEVLPLFARADSNTVDIAAFYHLVPKPSGRWPRVIYGQFPYGVAVHVEDGSTLYRVSFPAMTKAAIAPPRVIRDTLHIVIGPDTLLTDLRTIIATLRPGFRGDYRIPPEATALPLIDMHGKRRGYLTILDITVDHTKARPLVQRLDGILTIR